MLSPVEFERQQKMNTEGVQKSRGYSHQTATQRRLVKRTGRACATHYSSPLEHKPVHLAHTSAWPLQLQDPFCTSGQVYGD